MVFWVHVKDIDSVGKYVIILRERKRHEMQEKLTYKEKSTINQTVMLQIFFKKTDLTLFSFFRKFPSPNFSPLEKI